jgi:TRAP-type C4-dicarboxylate transport system substrate-binding protein
MIEKAGRMPAALILFAALLFSGPPAASAEEYKITVAAGHPPVFLWVGLCRDFFIPEVDRRLAEAGGRDKIFWNQVYGGTLCPLGGCLEAVEAGVADVGLVATVFNAAQMPLHNVTYMTPFGTDRICDVIEVMGALQDNIPRFREEWERQNQVYLGGIALDSYHLFTDYPVEGVDDLDGRKIAAPGPSANWLKGTGAVAVAADLNTYYNDIKTGVYDGALTFATAASAIDLHEVAPYMCLVDFGAQFASALTINADLFASFPAEVRQVFLETGREYSRRLARAQMSRAAAALTDMEQEGARVTRLDFEARKHWASRLPNVPLEWAETMEQKGLPGRAVLSGYLDGLRRRGVRLPRDWDR